MPWGTKIKIFCIGGSLRERRQGLRVALANRFGFFFLILQIVQLVDSSKRLIITSWQLMAIGGETWSPNPGSPVQVQDLVKSQTIIYSSYREAARVLNIDKQIISDYFNRNQIKPYKKRYIFTKV
jgi:hypothetical protein